jgi:esterase/lipase
MVRGSRRRRSKLGIAARLGGALLAILIAVLAVLALVPSSTDGFWSQPNPAADYRQAVSRFKKVRAAERKRVYEPCKSRLLEHGEQTEVAVVLVHGLTNCPRQFLELAERIHSTGANVLVLRAPRHGRADGSGEAIGGVGSVGDLTPDELRNYADDSVDIAAGLGEEVRVLGLSMGGAVATWIAQNRDDVDRVVAVAPALTLPKMPGVVDYAFVNLFNRLPNISLPGSTPLTHAYDGESTRALAAMYKLGKAVRQAADTVPARAGSIVVVTNANDNQVDNGDILALADSWQELGAEVRTHEFPKRLGLPHDVIDVQQPEGNPDRVYPVLLGLLGFGG